MRKLLSRTFSLAIIASMGIPLLNAETNDYSIEVKNDAFSKHSRDGLYGITYTEENTTYTDNNWPLVECYLPYYQSNGSYNIARHQMVRQFGVSMGVVYWINPAENYIYWWNTVTGENGKTRPTKSYGVGYQDGINNPNFDFTFLGAETGPGSISHDWYGNLVHMWNEGLSGWGTTAGTHFVRGYAVYKAPTEYGQLMDFIPKLSRLNDTGRENYPFYQRIVTGSTEGVGTLEGASASDHAVSNYTYYAPSSKTSNPNYPADEVTWNNNWYHHKAHESIAKQPTDFLGVSGNLWGVGYMQNPSAKYGDSDYSMGWSTGQVFHARNDIVYGNMFADGQYTNWYLNYRLSAVNAKNYLAYPNGLFAYNETLYDDSGNAIRYRYKPSATAFDNYPTEYLFRETDVLEYFWSIPNGGLVEYNVNNTVRVGYQWDGFVWDLDLGLSMYSYIDETGNRSFSDAMSAPEVDSIKGSRVMVHNLWLQFTPGEDTGNEDKRNGSYMIRSSKYTGGLSTTSAPVFTGSPTRTYDFKGYGYGYNKTPNAPEAFINTGVNCWSELERVNDNVFALYTHVPGQGFSKSFITAVKPGNAVSNLKVAKQYMNANNQVVNQLTWTPQTYDRATMHTYEVWYRRKRSGSSTYKDYKTIDGTSRAVWNYAGKASVKYNGATDSTLVNTNNRSGVMPNKTFYNSYTAESCTFEHVAPHDTDGSNNYDMVYEYMIIPLYDRSAHRGTESAVVTSTTKAPSCPVTGTFAQVTDKNANGETLYGFSVQLDSKVDITKTGANSAQIMLIVPQDDVTKTELVENTGVTVSTGDVSESTSASATYSIMGTNDLTVNGYHVVVDGFSVGENGELPTVTWHNINPDKEYKVKVYVVRTSSSYFIPSDVLATTLYVPEPKLTLPDAGFYKLVGDYGTLTENEDMPIGSFRRIDPATNTLDMNPTNPVTLNNANYYGTNGGALSPILVTDEVLGTLNANGEYENNGWRVGYIIRVFDKDAEGKDVEINIPGDCDFQVDAGGWSTVYSNVHNVMCDIVGLKVDYTTEEGEDDRDRKRYNPTAKTYKVEVELEYYRDKDKDGDFNNDLFVNRKYYTELKVGTTTLPELGVKNATNSTVLGALYQRSGSHFYYDNATSNGYYPYYYDAAMLFNWDEYNSLNRYMGYYGKSTLTCYGHYENPEHNPDTWVQYHAGSILTDDQVNSLNSSNAALTNGTIGYDGSNNWSAKAIENNQVPMLIHYVHGSNAPLASTEEAVSNIKFNVTLTAEYPVVSYANSLGIVHLAENPNEYSISNGEMNVMTVPTKLTDMYVNNTTVTTGVEGIITNACGGWQLYPNPVGSVFTLQAPMTIGNVQIFTMDGQLVKVVKDVKDTTVKINVDELPQGVYIVNTLGVAKMMIKQ